MPSIRTMIIPAAGYGTRMQGLTGQSSKEIIDVCGRPALMYALGEALEAGLERVGIVIRPEKSDILEMVRDDIRMAPIRSRIEIQFFYQEAPTGEAGAIQTAEAWIGDAPFAVHYPDNIIVESPGTLARLIARRRAIGSDLVLLTSYREHVQAAPCGLDALGDGVFRLTPDKQPEAFPYGLRPTGIYIASRRFLSACRRLLAAHPSVEVKDRDVRGLLAGQGHPIHAADLAADVIDIGNPDGYRAGIAFLEARRQRHAR